jgi:hypothetical protein
VREDLGVARAEIRLALDHVAGRETRGGAQDGAPNHRDERIMRGMRSLAGVLVALSFGAACGAKQLATPDECNPLGGLACALPWPSSIYEKPDPSSASGVRLDLAPGALPTSSHQVAIDPAPWNARTGFSPATQIFTAFPVAVDGSTLIGYANIPASLTDASPTVLVDMSTGMRVPHWAELDANATDPTQQALYLRPAVRLRGGTRYAVAIRKSLTAIGGAALPVPEGFAAILSGETTTHARLEAIRAGYADVFAALATAGVPKDDLVVAWDFTTATDADVTGDTLAARDAALAAMGDRGAALNVTVTLDESPDSVDATIARHLRFDYDVPSVLAGDGTMGFARGPDGKPMVAGMTTAQGAAIVPPCATAQAPAAILIFGHGFFGGLPEGEGEHLRRVSRDLCVVVVSGVWTGMSQDDLGFAATALADANRVPAFGQRIVQGIIDFIALEQLVRGKLATQVLVDAQGRSIVDPTRVYFLGISMGSILGHTFFAYDPFLTRGVMHVTGAPWSLLFERSTDWAEFSAIAGSNYKGALPLILIEQVLQMGFDWTDPIHLAPTDLHGGVPGTPAKQFLHQISVGDAQVTNLAGELEAGAMGLPVLAPSVIDVPYGLTAQAGPLSSGLAIYDLHPTPLPPASNVLNATDNQAHNDTRKYEAVVQQMGTFFSTGQIVQTCTGGACDCAAGACGPLGL